MVTRIQSESTPGRQLTEAESALSVAIDHLHYSFHHNGRAELIIMSSARKCTIPRLPSPLNSLPLFVAIWPAERWSPFKLINQRSNNRVAEPVLGLLLLVDKETRDMKEDASSIRSHWSLCKQQALATSVLARHRHSRRRSMGRLCSRHE